MEIALEPDIPTYSGGLGILAGDTLRSAADLGTPVVAVTLAYRKGYFRQILDPAGNQFEQPQDWVPEQQFTLDGIAGAQTFALPASFSNLKSLRIAEDSANRFSLDIVQIDNVRFVIVPEPGTWSLIALAAAVGCACSSRQRPAVIQA